MKVAVLTPVKSLANKFGILTSNHVFLPRR